MEQNQTRKINNNKKRVKRHRLKVFQDTFLKNAKGGGLVPSEPPLSPWSIQSCPVRQTEATGRCVELMPAAAFWSNWTLLKGVRIG